jgi:hypothetical protein
LPASEHPRKPPTLKSIRHLALAGKTTVAMGSEDTGGQAASGNGEWQWEVKTLAGKPPVAMGSGNGE